MLEWLFDVFISTWNAHKQRAGPPAACRQESEDASCFQVIVDVGFQKLFVSTLHDTFRALDEGSITGRYTQNLGARSTSAFGIVIISTESF